MATDLFKKALDPDNDLKHITSNDGENIDCTYKDKKISYDDYLDIHEERSERIGKGKKPGSIGSFSGFGPGTMKKSYEK